MEIIYTKGDATRPDGTGNKIIAHICNDIGGWGKGFVMAISKRWPAPEQQYRQWYQSKQNFTLGEVQFVPVEPDTWVANMIGQQRVTKDAKGNPPIRYKAVQECLRKVAAFAKEGDASLHMPRILIDTEPDSILAHIYLRGGRVGCATTLVNLSDPVEVCAK